MLFPSVLASCHRLIARLLVISLCAGIGAVHAQIQSTPNTLYRIAGGTEGPNNGAGPAAQFSSPYGITKNIDGNLYVADTSNHAIRKITPAGIVSTFAGSLGTCGSADGDRTTATFCVPFGIVADAAGALYVTDQYNHTVRKITAAGVVTTIAGSAGVSGSTDGAGADARFYSPGDITADTSGNLYVVDRANATVRKITSSGVVSTVAGSAGMIGSTDGPGTAARFYNPSGITFDTAGNLYVADNFNHTIRKITPDGNVTTLAGTAGVCGSTDGSGANAKFCNPFGIKADVSGNLYVTDSSNSTIRKITASGVVSTVVGTAGVNGDVLGPLPGQIVYPDSIAVIGANQLAFTTDAHEVLGANLATATVSFANFSPLLTLTNTGNSNRFNFTSSVTLGANGQLFDPAADIVSLEFGSVTVTIPAGSFQPASGGYTFSGQIGSVTVSANIQAQGAGRYRVGINGSGANQSGITNPVSVTLKLGNNTGTKSITATISGSAGRPR